MESFNNNFSDIFFGCDSKTSFLSLQLLEEVARQVPHQQINPNIVKPESDIDQVKDKYQCIELNLQQQKLEESNIPKQSYQEQSNSCLQNLQEQLRQIEPKKLIQAKSQDYCLSNIENTVFQAQKSHTQLNQSLNQSQSSKQISNKQSYLFQQVIQQPLRSSMNSLKQLQQKGRLQLQQADKYSQQIKNNFQVLFQKVYGIIQQIQLRNEKTELGKSIIKNNLKAVPKKELTLNTKVIQLSVGKQKERMKKKKFNHLQTEFNLTNNIQNDTTNQKNYLLTQQNVYPKTPFANSSRPKSTNLLTLSKKFPRTVKPQSNLNSARSNRSTRSKGLTLVSADKNIQKIQLQTQTKKPMKITLVQKKITACPKKNIQLAIHSKAEKQKKTNGFNANNFFNARRISTARIV